MDLSTLLADYQQRLGNNVKAARLAAGLSQKQLSERCGIPQPNISEIENGNVNLTLETLVRLAAGLETGLMISFRTL